MLQHQLIIDIVDQMGQFGAHNLIFLTSISEQIGLGFYGWRFFNWTLLQRHASDCHRLETLTWCEISYEWWLCRLEVFCTCRSLSIVKLLLANSLQVEWPVNCGRFVGSLHQVLIDRRCSARPWQTTSNIQWFLHVLHLLLIFPLDCLLEFDISIIQILAQEVQWLVLQGLCVGLGFLFVDHQDLRCRSCLSWATTFI